MVIKAKGRVLTPLLHDRQSVFMKRRNQFIPMGRKVACHME